MNEKKVGPEFEDQIGRSFGAPEIDHAFADRLEAELMHRADLRMARRARLAPRLRWGLGLSAAALLLALFFFAAPQGRALAEAIGHLFKIATVTEIPIDHSEIYFTPTPEPTFSMTLAPAGSVLPTPTPTPAQTAWPDQRTPTCEDDPCNFAEALQKTEQQVGYNLMVFATDPAGLRLEGVYVDPDNYVLIHYIQAGGITGLDLTQGWGNLFPEDASNVPADAIQPVLVGEFAGEYVRGTFAFDSATQSYAWFSDIPVFTLRWMDAERWYEIRLRGSGAQAFSSADGLIQLALTLTGQPVEESALRANDLKSAAEAEQISGFDLLEPALLPEGFVYSHATWDEAESQVEYYYAPPDQDFRYTSIAIRAKPAELFWQDPIELGVMIDPRDMLAASEEVDINGQVGKYFSWSDASHALVWQHGDLVYSMQVLVSTEYGGKITTEQVLEIARSMK
ncbi:hypothetical protein LARV_03831 [Longilinea arvoryzae]|uniref:DUF4367 domain-containing protein n=1 Tax=Longilinea arvoryzae TaxID=360412 RepID=A0A0K8MXU9_9CHLR|nr:DUF4367 domain-containing protein [Longilinea arvoryzae]GAP16035.1 hypothetical protein LARV_03831 [Longilinea arvoryzae]